MRVYKLDLDSLLPLLREFHQNGCLSTVLPSDFLGMKAPCKVRIDLVDGKINYCHIEDSRGRVRALDNQKSFNALYSLGALNWRLDDWSNAPSISGEHSPVLNLPQNETSTSSPYLPVPIPQYPTSPVPKIAVNIEPRTLNALSRRHRRVLVLVDGIRNVEKITEILFPSSRDPRPVLEVLRELEAMGLITRAK